MSFDSDDSVSLSGSESELDFDDIFGESEDEDDDFEGFVNNEIPAEIQRQWSRTADDNRQHFTEFNAANAGPTRNNTGKNPAEIFGLFLNEEILLNIKTWTNRNAAKKRTENPRQHRTPWTPVETTSELRAFFGVLMAMNDLIEKPRYENYFERNEQFWLLHSPGFWKVFSQQRFNQIKRYIFFSDPDAQIPPRNDENFDRLHKVRPFLDYLTLKFRTEYNCGRELTLDEAMVPFKGRLGIKQRIASKPVPWGIKLWVLTDANNSYLTNVEVYLGKESDPNERTPLKKTGAVVVRLTRDYQGKGHHLYVDNFYSSPYLFLFLKTRELYASGTVNSNRAGYPRELADEAKGINQGEFRWRQFNELVATVWQDTKAVNFLSVVHPASETVQVTRNRRQREGGRTVHRQIQIDCPKVASEYGKFMGGVDRNDQMTRVRKGQKQMRWYMRLVIKFLEIAAYNAYILDGYIREHEPQGSRKYDLHCFKKQMVMALVGNTRAPQKTPGRKRRHVEDRLLNVGRHFPEKGEGKNHRCVVCLEKRRRLRRGDGDNVPNAAKTTFKCTECDVYLCILKEQNCFKKYHTQVEFWRDTVADNNSSDSEDD